MRAHGREIRTVELGTVVALVTLLGFAIRLFWILEVQSPFTAVYSDMGGYMTRAEDLLRTSASASAQPTGDPRLLAFYPWGTHVLIAMELAVVGKSLVGIAIIHAAVGAATVAFTTLLAARFDPRRSVVALVGLVAALWQPQITSGAFFMSEMWYSAALTGGSWLFVRALDRSQGRAATASSALGAGVLTAIAFAVRPQVLLTCVFVGLGLLPRIVREVERGSLPRAALRYGRIVVLVGLPLLITIGASAERLHRLSGRYGLISENGELNRVFADTDVGKLESEWIDPHGRPNGAWYSPQNKQPLRPESIVRFRGYIGDPEILERIRREHVEGVPIVRRIERALRNASYLVWRNYPNPEEDFRADPRRRRLQRFFANATLALLPLAVLGLAAARRSSAALVVASQLVTIAVVAAFYFAEARHRVPYDPFLVIAGISGGARIARRLLALLLLLARRSRLRRALRWGARGTETRPGTNLA
jgi:hypothetical protein